LSIGRFEVAEGFEYESWDDKSDEAVAVVVACATLYPTIGIAATVDDSDNVVVTIMWVVGHPEANVNTMSLDTLEIQRALVGTKLV
jgi:hypothetical protein